MQITVKCYAGYRGEETPRAILFGEKEIVVVSVTDRWLGPDHRYFKIIGEDGGTYIIRYDVVADVWELTLYRHPDMEASFKS